MKDPKKVAAGKKSRKLGNEFEKRVREDLEKRGWAVDKWTNNVDIEQDKLKPVRPMWANGRMLMNSGGFPDFICTKKVGDAYDVIGVESKMDGKLDKKEIEKCKWLLEKNVFSTILIAEKITRCAKIVVFYNDFSEVYDEV